MMNLDCSLALVGIRSYSQRIGVDRLYFRMDE